MEFAAGALLGVCLMGWVLRFLRRPDGFARRHRAGRHQAWLTVRHSSTPWRILSRTSNARVDLYDDALVVTPLAPRWVIHRAEIVSVQREEHGAAVAWRGPATVLTTASAGHMRLGTDDDGHAALQRWWARTR